MDKVARCSQRVGGGGEGKNPNCFQAEFVLDSIATCPGFTYIRYSRSRPRSHPGAVTATDGGRPHDGRSNKICRTWSADETLGAPMIGGDIDGGDTEISKCVGLPFKLRGSSRQSELKAADSFADWL